MLSTKNVSYHIHLTSSTSPYYLMQTQRVLVTGQGLQKKVSSPDFSDSQEKGMTISPMQHEDRARKPASPWLT